MGIARDRYRIIRIEMGNTSGTEIENTRERDGIIGTEMRITIL